MTFYRCAHCGNIVVYIRDSGVRVRCCGEEMQKIVPNTADAAGEKHVPVIEVKDQTVTVAVGSVEHPMLDAHFIEWIMLETREGRQRKTLKPEDRPVAVFSLVPGDEAVAAYEYCRVTGVTRTRPEWRLYGIFSFLVLALCLIRRRPRRENLLV